eukprot:CAMPEP_0197027088 /NCGR_PEP_ID=MMETSP1384-20130603/7064_1 /TAXON_ID=29189 /ORGANISM="Ammonia sp." /LENGTH=229 /DNA_ID=CAMNT_0042455883 /DNA_START=78 /DNA_END=767 /DNA_ORIENTATION=+
MTVRWKAIAESSLIDQVSQETGTYVMVKTEEALSVDDQDAFGHHIGLARHEYIDAMICVAEMKYKQDSEMQKYAKLNKLCEENLIPFIWGGMENAEEATVKGWFRPYSTELHRLFDKYINAASEQEEQQKGQLLSLETWMALCGDVLKQDKVAFSRGGKPTEMDITSAFELAKEGTDLALSYKGFEKALQNLARKMYKLRPKAKYASMEFPEKLKKLLKWCVKLEKSKK